MPVDAFTINDKFSCMLSGLGFDAQVAHNFARKAKRGLFNYTKESLLQFFKAQPYGFEMKLPDFSFFTDAFLISVANSNQFGNNVTIAPEAKLNDGLLDVIVVQKMHKVKLPYAILKQLSGNNKMEQLVEDMEHKNILYFQTPSLEISNPKLAPLHITCSVDQAQTILDNWKYKAFVKAGKWLDNAGKSALVHGYSKTRLGRRRWFDLEFAKLHQWRKHAIAREASNAPIQGACADIVKLAMIKIHKQLNPKHARIILTVHDELIIECDTRHVTEASAIMKWGMESAAQDLLPIMGKNVIVSVNVSQKYDK
jgi:hypothetical protein